MTKEKLFTRSIIYRHEHGLEEDPLPILKRDLKVGLEYGGECRNADRAVWNGQRFVYRRYKFGDVFDEEINHFEDDDGYDVFVPFEELQLRHTSCQASNTPNRGAAVNETRPDTW